MATYATLDYLQDLSTTKINSAKALTFQPYQPSSPLINWDNSASFSTSAYYAPLSDNFVFNAVEGATYDIFSSSFFDPFILLLYDNFGNVIAHDDGSGIYGSDYIFNFVAPYTGKYYVSASWYQGSASSHKFVSLRVYEDIDTISQQPYTIVENIGGFTMLGTSGNDEFIPNYEVFIFGSEGIDKITFDYDLDHVSLDIALEDKNIITPGGIQHFGLVERVTFTDVNLAVDIGFGGNAGIVAKTLGAVFGSDSLSNKELFGTALKLVDSGLDYESLVGLAINTRLGVNQSFNSVVDLLYTNVVGVIPSNVEKSNYVNVLETGAFSVASLGVLAAESTYNTENIDFVGLMSSGIEYV